MRRQFFSGNTIEQALMAAGRHFNLDPDRVAYSLRDKKHGFLNVRRRVVIEVDPAAPEKPESSAPVAVQRSRGDRPVATDSGPRDASPQRGDRPRDVSRQRGRPRGDGRDDGPPRGDRGRPSTGGRPAIDDRDGDSVWSHQEAIRKEFAATVEAAGDSMDREVAAFDKSVAEVIALLGMELEGSVRRGDDGFEVEITGEDRDLLVEEDGRVLRSIEHLLPRLVRGLLGRGLPCRVDSAGFQAEREAELRDLAEETADLAHDEERPQTLEPMNPADRRIVHMTLADDPDVRTESAGEGYMKRVRVLPVYDPDAEDEDEYDEEEDWEDDRDDDNRDDDDRDDDDLDDDDLDDEDWEDDDEDWEDDGLDDDDRDETAG